MSKQKTTRPTRPTTIRRAKHDRENPFVITSKDLPQNREMTYAARGMLWYLLSQPQDWEVMIHDLQQQCGRDKVYALIDELRRFGHIRRPAPTRDSSGRWVWQPYEVYEYPVEPDTDDSPLPENPEAVTRSKPLPASPYTVNPEIKQNTDSTDQLNKLTPPVGATAETDNPKARRDFMFETISWAWNNTSGGYVGKLKKLLTGQTSKKDGKNHQPYFGTVHITPVEVVAVRLWRDRLGYPMPDSPETIAQRFEQFRGIPDVDLYMSAAERRFDLSERSGILFYNINWADPTQWPVIIEDDPQDTPAESADSDSNRTPAEPFDPDAIARRLAEQKKVK